MMKFLIASVFVMSSTLGAAAAGYGDDTPSDNAELDAAIALIDAKDYAGAAPKLQELAKANPDDADIHNLLGFSLRKTGALEESGVAYARALELEPYHARALEYQGELFLMLGDVKSAEANLDKLSERCGFPCEEKDLLAAAIKDWRAQNTQ